MSLPYQDLSVHRWMLRDRQRVEAFERALLEQVRPGSVVLDVGAGSGILSLLAARAGAARVYAVEATPVARLARHLAAANGCAGTIRVIEADMLRVSLPEPVDLIVSEWLGSIGVDENLLYPVLLARDRWLKPGGVMLPAEVSAWLAPCDLATSCEAGFLRERPYGLEFGALSEYSVHELLMRRYQVRPGDLACPAQRLWFTDTATFPAAQALRPNEAELGFEFTRAREINALVAWFDARLAPHSTLGNAPDAPETHWGQLTLPLERRLGLAAGDRLTVRIVCAPRVPGLSDMAWSVRVNDGPWLHQDTRIDPGNAGALGTTEPPPDFYGDITMQASTPFASAGADGAPPDPAAAIAAVPSVHEAATLTRFLARVSVDTDLLYRLIVDPAAVFQEAELSEEDIAALTSREALQIEHAMMRGAKP